MTNLLTKTLLLQAADRISPTYFGNEGGEKFMCHAVHTASGATWGSGGTHPNDNPVVLAFEALLVSQGVRTNGTLRNEFFCVDDMPDDEKMALRFDFLNLLAESL